MSDPLLGDLEERLRRGLGAPEPAGPPELGRAAERAGLLDVAVASTDAPVGRLILAATPAGLVACSYDDEDAVAERLARTVSPRVLRAPWRLDPIRRQLDDYFDGLRSGFSGPVDLALASPFACTVLSALAEVGYGGTTTYGELAARIGRPSAARAVGAALGANPVCIVVPCHRVLAAGGRLGGYAGGVPAKRLLLDLEAAGAEPPPGRSR
jgi:methylated-DNA-[protein]-cysteine S-methyltransferase